MFKSLLQRVELTPNLVRLLLGLDGRLDRAEFWPTSLWVIFAAAVVGFVPIIGCLSWLGLYCSVALNWKRLHDLGRPGWMQVFPVLVVAGLCVLSVRALEGRGPSANEVPSADNFAAMGVCLATGAAAVSISLIFFIWLARTPGASDENRYGPAGPQG
jgi:uncharacterized membrane protein YhaH (DUF805 family)